MAGPPSHPSRTSIAFELCGQRPSMKRLVVVAVCCLLLDGAIRLVHPQSSVFLLEQERVHARQLFEALIRVAAIPTDMNVSFSVLESANLIAAFFEHGC